jgi:PAP2 superfamily protein
MRFGPDSVLIMAILRMLVLGALVSLATPAWAADGHRDVLGPLFDAATTTLPRPPVRGGNAVLRWNSIAIDASGLDHTPVADGEQRDFGEQLGPGRSSRAMAIVHIAMFDAANAVQGGAYRSYTGIGRAPRGTSFDAAVSQAAHDTLVALYPSQARQFHLRLAESLFAIADATARRRGIAVGKAAAAAILALRAGDGSAHDEPRVGIEYIPSDQPGHWRQDPISQIPIALGAYWGAVAPFVLESGDQFRTPPPPALDSPEYSEAFEEVKALGADGEIGGTPSARTDDQTLAGIYWAYDGTPSLCAPPRLYNQITVLIARQQRTGVLELARLLALVNVAMADTGIAVWDSKYHYDFWRPVAGIREADSGTGPTGLGDGNPDTVGDPEFSPLGAPASNLQGPNFTPPFPAYPSGHAGFGGALFQTLRRFYRTDAIAFTFVSDELDGVTVGNDGAVRPLAPRHFGSLSQAEEENGQSRIYLGIHWAFDKTAGIAQGRKVADYVFDHAFGPAR